jgi:NhaP-type Na+/H+ or K+/H+ antiporter
VLHHDKKNIMRSVLSKLSLLIIAVIISQVIAAQSVQKLIDTKIEKATVFLNGAQINRTGKVLVNPGASEIIFSGISPYINPQSIQVKCEANFTVLSVKSR